MKRKVDRDTVQRLQKENNGLRKYMDTAEKHSDILNAMSWVGIRNFSK
jgi:hypothetical protein